MGKKGRVFGLFFFILQFLSCISIDWDPIGNIWCPTYVNYEDRLRAVLTNWTYCEGEDIVLDHGEPETYKDTGLRLNVPLRTMDIEFYWKTTGLDHPDSDISLSYDLSPSDQNYLGVTISRNSSSRVVLWQLSGGWRTSSASLDFSASNDFHLFRLSFNGTQMQFYHESNLVVSLVNMHPLARDGYIRILSHCTTSLCTGSDCSRCGRGATLLKWIRLNGEHLSFCNSSSSTQEGTTGEGTTSLFTTGDFSSSPSSSLTTGDVPYFSSSASFCPSQSSSSSLLSSSLFLLFILVFVRL